MFEMLIDPLLPPILFIAGLLGLFYGINKLMKTSKHESVMLKYIALGTSIVIGIVNILVILEWKVLPFLEMTSATVDVHWLTVFLIFMAGSTMLADPLKDTPVAAIVGIIAFGAISGLFLLISDFSEGIFKPQLLGTIPIPLSLLILIIVIVVALIFALTFISEFTIDRILEIISWAPIVIIFSALLAIQGILIVLLEDAGGIWAIIPL